MRIKRILTNNAIVTVGNDNREKIICGKGIAYKKRVGDYYDVSLIERTFVLENDKSLSKFEQILTDIPLEYIQLAYDIVMMAREEFGKNFNDSMVITLSDHIYIAIERYGEGVNISNPLLYDIRTFYKTEYEIGRKALKLIEQKFRVSLPEDEAGFIALHIVSAQLDDTNMEYTFQVTKVVHEIIQIVKYYYSTELDTDSAFYCRFVTHLKFFALRLFMHQQYDDGDDGELLNIIKSKYIDAYQCALEVKEHLFKIYHYILNKDEILYLTIHVHRVVNKADAEGGMTDRKQ